MSKMISSTKFIEEFSKTGIKPLLLKKDPLNKIVEICTDAMRVRGIPPIKMTRKEYAKIQNQETEESIKKLRKYLQKRMQLTINIRNRITFP